MRYYAPRQRQKDGRWDYTIQLDGYTRPIGYCEPHEDLTESMAKLGIPYPEEEKRLYNEHASQHHADGHATEEEACQCYRQYLLDHKLRLNQSQPDEQLKCQICEAWTTLRASVGWQRNYVLCEAHQTPEAVASLFTSVGETWAS